MEKTAEELIAKVNSNIELLIKDQRELRKIMFGEGKGDGMIGDVHTIKNVLVGDKYQGEGLIAKVERLEEFQKKIQNMSTFTLSMIGIGAGVGTFITWVAHRWDKIGEVFK